jgi:hypothetical protein
LRLHEADEEVINHIANKWYEFKTLEAESIIDGSRNVTEGLPAFIVCIIGVAAVFYYNASIISKVIWSLACLGTGAQFLVGLFQAKIAKKVKNIMRENE